MLPVLIIDAHLIDHYSIICLPPKATAPTPWTGSGNLVKFVGLPTVDAGPPINAPKEAACICWWVTQSCLWSAVDEGQPASFIWLTVCHI